MSGPKHGIYLDAALEAIGQRVEERIDRIAARRRTALRTLIAALTATTLVGGAATAAALTVAAPAPSGAVERVDHRVACLDGTGPAPVSFFAARYELAAADAPRVDAAALCTAAWATLAESPRIADAAPERLLAAAAELLRGTSAPGDEAAEASAPVEVRATTAGFGPAAASGRAVVLAACPTPGGETVVLAAASAPPAAPRDPSELCRTLEETR